VAKLVRDTINPKQKAFIESADMFFLATADEDGQPDVSYKGGAPGFVRALDATTLAFPSYDGNGMFRSLGNLTLTANSGASAITLTAGGGGPVTAPHREL